MTTSLVLIDFFTLFYLLSLLSFTFQCLKLSDKNREKVILRVKKVILRVKKEILRVKKSNIKTIQSLITDIRLIFFHFLDF